MTVYSGSISTLMTKKFMQQKVCYKDTLVSDRQIRPTLCALQIHLLYLPFLFSALLRLLDTFITCDLQDTDCRR